MTWSLLNYLAFCRVIQYSCASRWRRSVKNARSSAHSHFSTFCQNCSKDKGMISHRTSPPTMASIRLVFVLMFFFLRSLAQDYSVPPTWVLCINLETITFLINPTESDFIIKSPGEDRTVQSRSGCNNSELRYDPGGHSKCVLKIHNLVLTLSLECRFLILREC